MRITVEVKNDGFTESGLRLADRDGNSYHWITRHHGHVLFFMQDEFVKVRMTIEDGYWGKIAKNVRLVK